MRNVTLILDISDPWAVVELVANWIFWLLAIIASIVLYFVFKKNIYLWAMAVSAILTLITYVNREKLKT